MEYPVIQLSAGDCSAKYVEGWRYAEWWLSRGGDVVADSSANWGEEKGKGFGDRLAEERGARQAGAAAGFGFFVDADGFARRTDDRMDDATVSVDLSSNRVSLVDPGGFVSYEADFYLSLADLEASGVPVLPV
ncbi:hypothetical protein [Cupriavidus sp. TMH.W2]|uniref:hypothetical protein n=1 Tax=Cupriavidus sp. TMH.W2 TaxID=3434465 RepID=UPI003D77203D